MKIVSRSECGLRPPKTAPSLLPKEQCLGIAFHYSGTLSDWDTDPCTVMRAHQNHHMKPGGLGAEKGGNDIAYNFELDKKGIFYEGRGWWVRSGANGTPVANQQFMAVCFQGADKENFQDFTGSAANAFTEFCQEFKRQKGSWPIVKGHRDFFNTACPGNEIYSFVQLKPWEVDFKPWPVLLPKWWWAWNAWRLGEGMFKDSGPKNPMKRHLTGAPKRIPPWAWARAVAFDKARKK